MLYEQMKDAIAKSKGQTSGKSNMNLLLVRPFDIVYKGERFPVIMVRVDSSGGRSFAIPNDEESTAANNEPLRWVAERWVEKVIPYDVQA